MVVTARPISTRTSARLGGVRGPYWSFHGFSSSTASRCIAGSQGFDRQRRPARTRRLDANRDDPCRPLRLQFQRGRRAFAAGRTSLHGPQAGRLRYGLRRGPVPCEPGGLVLRSAIGTIRPPGKWNSAAR